MASIYHLKTYKKQRDGMDAIGTAYLQNKVKKKKYPMPTPKDIRRAARLIARQEMEDTRDDDDAPPFH